MMEKDQARPLAPAAGRPNGSSDDDDEIARHLSQLRRRKWIKCCGCVAAALVLQAVAIIILIFTVFKVKDPVIRMNKITVNHLELVNGTVPKPGTNMSLTADVSVKNPNVASFRYSNTTTTLYYHGVAVGRALGPPGRSRARRTMRMNITVEIVTDLVMASPNLQGDVGSGLLRMSSYSRIPGRVKILNIVKKHVVVKMNCTMAVNISTQAIQEQKCKRKVDL